jgi:hypothetical protein
MSVLYVNLLLILNTQLNFRSAIHIFHVMFLYYIKLRKFPDLSYLTRNCSRYL